MEAGGPVATETARTFADGMDCRGQQHEPFEIFSKCAARGVAVSEDEIAEAVRILYTATHNSAEGAGAACFAALMQERARLKGKRAGDILSGGNIDMPVFAAILRGETPAV